MAKKTPPVAPSTQVQTPPRVMRADAQRNYEQLLAVARTVVAEQGTAASLRDIARRADVGLGTLYRHFPTREALLETLLRTGFDSLCERARALASARAPLAALTTWLQDFRTNAATYHGVAASLIATIHDESSPLHASCVAMRAAGERLLVRAQESGHIRPDVDGTDLFALINAIAWIGDQAPTIAARTDHLFSLLLDGLRPQGTKRKKGR